MVNWVGRHTTLNNMLNIANGKHRWSGRRLPEEAGITQGATRILKRRRKRHIEDKVSQAAAWARALDGPRNIKVALNYKPSVGMRLRQQGAQVANAEMALNNRGLRHEPEQGSFQLYRGTDGPHDALKVLAGRLEPHDELPDDRVKPALEVNKQGHGANTADTGSGKETTHTQGGKARPLTPKAAALGVQKDSAQQGHQATAQEPIMVLLHGRVEKEGAVPLHR